MALDGEHCHPPPSSVAKLVEEPKPLHAARLTCSDDYQRLDLESGGCMKTRIWIMEADSFVRRIDTERTLASIVLGKGSRAEAFLFKMCVKEKWPSRILWTSWWFGTVCGMLALVKAADSVLAFFSVFMLPLPIFALSVLSLDLVREVLQCSEFYMISGLQLFELCLAYYLIRDRRGAFWVFFFPTMICASFVDAYPAKFRALFSKLFFTSFSCVYLTWMAFLFFGWLDPVHDMHWEFGEIRGTTVFSIAQNTATLLLFCGRHLASAILTPNNFVLIMSPVKTTRIHVEPEMEMKDGMWTPTGKFVRDSVFQATKLDMAHDEIDHVKRRTSTISIASPKISDAASVSEGMERFGVTSAPHGAIVSPMVTLSSETECLVPEDSGPHGISSLNAFDVARGSERMEPFVVTSAADGASVAPMASSFVPVVASASDQDQQPSSRSTSSGHAAPVPADVPTGCECQAASDMDSNGRGRRTTARDPAASTTWPLTKEIDRIQIPMLQKAQQARTVAVQTNLTSSLWSV